MHNNEEDEYPLVQTSQTQESPDITKTGKKKSRGKKENSELESEKARKISVKLQPHQKDTGSPGSGQGEEGGRPKNREGRDRCTRT